jgi:hypothetical protein
VKGKINEKVQTKIEREIKIGLGDFAKRKNFLVLTEKMIANSVKTESKNQWVWIDFSPCLKKIPKKMKSNKEETKAKKKI